MHKYSVHAAIPIESHDYRFALTTEIVIVRFSFGLHST